MSKILLEWWEWILGTSVVDISSCEGNVWFMIIMT